MGIAKPSQAQWANACPRAQVASGGNPPSREQCVFEGPREIPQRNKKMIGQTKRPKWWHTHYKTPNNRQRAGVLLFYLALPRPTSLYLALPRSTSLYLALPRPISPYLALPRSTSLYLALPRPTSPHLAHQQGGRDLPAERPGLTSRAGTYQQGRDLRDRRGPGKRGGTGETGGGHSISPFVALSCCGLSASMTDSYTYPKHPNTCDPMSSQLIATHVSFHTNTTFTPTKRL